MSKVLENSVKIQVFISTSLCVWVERKSRDFILQWGKNQEIVLGTNFEWSVDGQFMIKSNASLTTPFPQLKQVSIELHHNTEWDSAQLFETRGSLILNELKYTAVVKGITKPSKGYEFLSFLSHNVLQEKIPDRTSAGKRQQFWRPLIPLMPWLACLLSTLLTIRNLHLIYKSTGPKKRLEFMFLQTFLTKDIIEGVFMWKLPLNNFETSPSMEISPHLLSILT